MSDLAPTAWYKAKLDAQGHHEFSLGWWMSQYHIAVEEDNWPGMTYALKMAHFHCGEASELKSQLDRWLPGGHEIR